MNLRRIGSALLVVAVLLAIWEAAQRLSGAPHYLLPTLWEVAQADWRERAKLAAAAWITGPEAAAALAGSTLARGGVVLVAGRHARADRAHSGRRASDPAVGRQRRAGGDDHRGVDRFFPILVNTTRGLLDVPREWLDLFATRAATPAQTLWKLRWPHALPAFFAGFRIAAGLSVVGAIAGEFFAGSARVGLGGLGYALSYADAQLQADYLFALVGVSSALGLGFYTGRSSRANASASATGIHRVNFPHS